MANSPRIVKGLYFGKQQYWVKNNVGRYVNVFKTKTAARNFLKKIK